VFLVGEAITGSVGAAYTFGKPVQGDLEIKAWRYVGKWEVYYTYNAAIDGRLISVCPPRLCGRRSGCRRQRQRETRCFRRGRVHRYTEATSRLLTVAESPVNVTIIPPASFINPACFQLLIVTETPDNQLVEGEVGVNITYYDKDFKEISHEAKYLTTTKGKALVDVKPPAGSIAMTITAKPVKSALLKPSRPVILPPVTLSIWNRPVRGPRMSAIRSALKCILLKKPPISTMKLSRSVKWSTATIPATL